MFIDRAFIRFPFAALAGLVPGARLGLLLARRDSDKQLLRQREQHTVVPHPA